jgi:hypothetical protein
MLLDVGWLDYSLGVRQFRFFKQQKKRRARTKSEAKVGSPPEKVGLENLTLFGPKIFGQATKLARFSRFNTIRKG